ncbi:hypothetical protein C5S31_10560 [ANME-1 cluster archaeon GoMg2]|nr:hypothetical protein [ANME-1 cluster archaeon GoMg2]
MNTKLVAGILIAALVATSIGVAAARYGTESGSRYMDANGDGVCDNIGERPGFVDEDDDGVCDNRGIRGFHGYGRNFVDADGDGICDNIGINGRDRDGDGIPNGKDGDYVPPSDGSGKQRGNGRGGNR